MRSLTFLNASHHTALVLAREGRVTYEDAMPDEDGYRIDGRQPDWYTCSALGDLLAAGLIRRAPASTSALQVALTADGREVAQ